MEEFSWITKLFLSFLVIKSLLESYLDHKNKSHIIANRNQVPKKFEEKISLEEHQKAADYSVAKIKSGQFFHIISFIVLLGWTVFGGLQSLDNLTKTFGLTSSIWKAIAFFGLFGVVSTIISLPQSLYTTFVLEERFGFNKTTPKLFIIDMIKGLVLGAVIGFPLIAAIIAIMERLGEFWWAYAWAFLTLFQFLLLWAYPRFIAPLFNKFSPMEEGAVKEKVLGLLNRTGFTSNGLFVMNASIRSSHGNAYFTGFGKNKRIVFFDTLIKTLEPGEVEAVLAHELGHFKKRHVVKMLIRGIIMSFLGFLILGKLLNYEPFFVGHGITEPNLHLSLILFAMVSGVYTFFTTPISSWISRKYEFEADEFASQHSDANELISALVKLYKDNASTLTPDPTYSAWYHSHPPALIRVEHLEGLSNS